LEGQKGNVRFIPTISLTSQEKLYFTLQSIPVGTYHTQPIKMDFLPPELSKTGQITSEAVLKNHNKSQKIIK
jgi:hypothetical protein